MMLKENKTDLEHGSTPVVLGILAGFGIVAAFIFLVWMISKFRRSSRQDRNDIEMNSSSQASATGAEIPNDPNSGWLAKTRRLCYHAR